VRVRLTLTSLEGRIGAFAGPSMGVEFALAQAVIMPTASPARLHDDKPWLDSSDGPFVA
jgi:hypothetical protein